MKILYVNIPTGNEKVEFGEFAKYAYVTPHEKEPGAYKITGHRDCIPFLRMRYEPCHMAFYRYIDHLASRMVYYSARNAKEEDFDAVVINCYGDPMLLELRQVLDIPVVGIGESTNTVSFLCKS